jgi:hypothetical protein
MRMNKPHRPTSVLDTSLHQNRTRQVAVLPSCVSFSCHVMALERVLVSRRSLTPREYRNDIWFHVTPFTDPFLEN